MKTSSLLVGIVFALPHAGVVFGQTTYPSRAIRLIVPQPPSGPNDVLSRVLAQKLGGALGQQIVVDNRGGAGGIIGGELVAQAAPDGYTLLFGGPGVLATAPGMHMKPPYDSIKDFAPISLVGTAQHVLLIHPSLPAKNVKDLIDLAKAKPGQLTFGGGYGAPTHLAGELFKSMAGVDVVHVAYKGGGPALIDLMANRITMYFSGISAALPLIENDKLRGIAVTGSKRTPVMPDTPTIAETVPGYEIINWYAVLAPAATSHAIIKKLNGEIAKALAAVDVKERFSTLGSDAISSTPQELGAFTRSEIAKWAKVMKFAGIKPK